MTAPAAPDSQLCALAAARFQRSIDVPQRFFEAEAERVALACLAMAQRFNRGGRLLAFGAGNAATDAQHVSVEFVHPVLMGKRALPAIALGTDIAATLGLAGSTSGLDLYGHQIATLSRPADIALGIDPTGRDLAVRAGLESAAARGLLTIYLSTTAGAQPCPAGVDFVFAVPSEDGLVIQETHETLYHVLWELVHVLFEHKHLLETAPAPAPLLVSHA